MNGPVLRVAWYRFRTTFRHRWSGYLALAVLIGLVGGVALGSLTAARRTYASYPNFLASTNPSDLLVVPQTSSPEPGLVHELARLPHVRSAEEGEQITAATLTPGGQISTVLDNPGGADRQPGRAVLRPGPAEDHQGPRRPTRRGRTRWWPRTRPPPSSACTWDQRIPVGIELDSAKNVQLYRQDRPDGGGDRRARHPARARRHRHATGPGSWSAPPRCCGNTSPAAPPTATTACSSTAAAASDVPVEQEYERLIDNPAASHGQLVVYETSAIEAEAQQAIRPEAIALAVFGVIALVAALVIGTQSISRQLYAGASQSRGAARAGRRPGGHDGGRAARRRGRRRGRVAARGGGSRRPVAAVLVRAGAAGRTGARHRRRLDRARARHARADPRARPGGGRRRLPAGAAPRGAPCQGGRAGFGVVAAALAAGLPVVGRGGPAIRPGARPRPDRRPGPVGHGRDGAGRDRRHRHADLRRPA